VGSLTYLRACLSPNSRNSTCAISCGFIAQQVAQQSQRMHGTWDLFDIGKSKGFSLSTYILGDQNFKLGHTTLITPIWGQFIIQIQALDMTCPYTKSEDCTFSRSKDMTRAPKF